MRVVHISLTPLAGAPWAIVQALREWTDVDARLIQVEASYPDGRSFPHDLIIREDWPEIRSVLADANLIHVHNYRMSGELRSLVGGKPLLVQYHSVPPVPRVYADTAKLNAVIAQPLHVQTYHDCRPLPNLVPIRDELYRPLWAEDGPALHNRLHVAYAPTTQAETGPASKGFSPTRAVLNRLQSKGLLTFDIITGVPIESCLKRKAVAHVVIDEVVTGNYHRASLESLAHGAVVLVNVTDAFRDFMERFLGRSAVASLPWLSTDMESLEGTLSRLCTSPQYVATLRRLSRLWMEDHWDDRVLVRHYTTAYDDVLNAC